MPEPDRPGTATAAAPTANPAPAGPASDPGSPALGSPADVFHRLVRGVCGRQLDELPLLYAEHTHVVHPLAPDRAPPLTTRQELAAHFRLGFEALGEIRFTPAAMTVHQTADPEVIIGEFEYRGVAPGTGEPFTIPNIYVVRVRDGQVVESRDYADHLTFGRLLGRVSEQAGARPAAEDWRARAQRRYEDSVFGGDTAALDAADRELSAVEADLALARGRVMHARFLAGGPADETTLSEFERAAALYAGLGDARGEAEARFWMATFHQVVRGDNQVAMPLLEQAGKLAADAGDRLTLSYVARHIGFAQEAAGQLDTARSQLEQSLRIRRELGFQRGVAAALLALAWFAGQHGAPGEARDLLDEADAVARAHDAEGIRRRIDQARTEMTGAA
jgi:ketosteroid isomerase-like protein